MPQYHRSRGVRNIFLTFGVMVVLILACTGFVSAAPLESSFSIQSEGGYTLVSPLFGTQSFLLNEQQQVVHTWELAHESGGTAYLLDNGDLLQTGTIDASDVFTDAVHTGGSGYINRYSWDGEMQWEYTLHTDKLLQHHDIEPMPNGNVMLIAYERFLRDDAIAAGRNPDEFPPGRDEFWSEALLEIDPNTNETVWEWHVWDHLVQDFNPDEANYANPAEHPALIDINYIFNFPNYTEDIQTNIEWLHANSVDYNEKLDQILFSARQFNEIWIIDHSTTTAESSDHSGGRYGKGGDLLFRWGNPAAYKSGDAGADRILYFQHDARWIDDGHPGAGNITVFDDGSYEGRPSSRVLEVAIDKNEDGSYDLSAGQQSSAAIVWEYAITTEYSFILGAVQRLANGNTLVVDGYHSHLLEVTSDGSTVWDWRVPDGAYLFRADRYEADYPAFAGKTLTGVS